MEKSQAEDYLTFLLNKTLRVTTTDTRMFLGQFKCTDSDRNIILSQTFEYRLPPPPKPTSTSSTSSTLSTSPSTSSDQRKEAETISLDLSSRYMGLVVVPGEYISKIEVEEFESQVRGRNVGDVGVGAGKEV